MGREGEHIAETPRRPRVKREKPTVKFDPVLHATQYGSSSAGSGYGEEGVTPVGGTKRKRVKKEREDEDPEWTPTRLAPPPPPPFAGEISVKTNDPQAHTIGSMHTPTILNHTMASPTPMYETSHHQQHMQQGSFVMNASTSIFEEAPAVIHSFSETERRRNSGNTVLTQDGEAVDAVQPTPRNGSSGCLPISQSRSSGSTSMSVLDLFYPQSSRSARSGAQHGGVENTQTTARESKRRKRNEPASGRSSSRARGARSTEDEGYVEYDMLRFGVDSFKLIPQGLVDRVDPRMRGEFVANVIVSHVENWYQKAGFGSNFVQEVTTLLTAYYPCPYPTILDEILASFVMKRPELLEELLKPIIDKMIKTGETANPTKYPVIDSIARKCTLIGVADRDRARARHSLGCLTLLRTLVEQNTEKFSLTPWIAACADHCSPVVLCAFWTQLIQSCIAVKKSSKGTTAWVIPNPLDQVFELLREEKQAVRTQEKPTCGLSRSLLQTLLGQAEFLEFRTSAVAAEAMALFFANATAESSTQLLHLWIEQRAAETHDVNEAWAGLLETVITNCSRLSVKKTSWFVRHIVRFALSRAVHPFDFRSTLTQSASLFFAAADKVDMDELNDIAQNSQGSNLKIVGDSQTAEKYVEGDVSVQLQALYDVLRVVRHSSAFIDAWSTAWCPEDASVLIPWCYVWSILQFAVHLTVDGSLETTIGHFAERLCDKYFAWLLSVEPRRKSVASRASRVLQLVVTSPHAHARMLLVRMLRTLSSTTSPTAQTIFTDVTMSRLTDSSSASAKADSTTPPRLCMLQLLAELVRRDDSVGDHVRELAQTRRFSRVLVGVVTMGTEVEIGLVLDILCTSFDRPWSPERKIDIDGAFVRTLVVYMYEGKHPAAQQVAILLQRMSSKSKILAMEIVRYLLRVGSSYCCGCTMSDAEKALVQRTTVVCADLVNAIVQSCAPSSVDEVLEFSQQRIKSCSGPDSRWNTFLARVLQHLIQSGLALRSVSLARVVIAPFGDDGDDDGDVQTQLRVLHTMLAELLAAPLTDSKWAEIVTLASNAQLRSRLRVVSSESSCSMSAALATSILQTSTQLQARLMQSGY